MKPHQNKSRKWIISFFLISFCSLYNLTCKPDPISAEPLCLICPPDFRLTDFQPAWSPDGKTIAYVHGDTVLELTGIYLIDTNSTNNRILYSSPGAYSPTWSPDGQWIAFSDNAQIYKIKVNGDSLLQLTTSGNNFFPSWSYDGKWIAYDSNNDSPNGMNFIWKMDINGVDKIRVVYEPTNCEIRMPSWTKDNKIIHIRYPLSSSEIYIMNDDGSNPKRLTFNNATDYYPRFSSAENEFVFTSQPYARPTNISKYNITSIVLVDNAYSQDFSPNGQFIVYTNSKSDDGRLWIMDKNGSNKRKLTFDN